MSLCYTCGQDVPEPGEAARMQDQEAARSQLQSQLTPKLQPITVIPLPYTLAAKIRCELGEAGMIDRDGLIDCDIVEAVIARVLIHAGKQEAQT